MSHIIKEGIEYSKVGILQIGFYYGPEGKILHVFQDLSYDFKVKDNYEVESIIKNEFELYHQCSTDPEYSATYLECTDPKVMKAFIQYINQRLHCFIKQEEWMDFTTKSLLWEMI